MKRPIIQLAALCLCVTAVAWTGRQAAGADPAPAQDPTIVYLPLVRRPGTQAPMAPTLKWQRGGCYASWCETGWYASPAVADLDGDNRQEVIGAAYSLVILDGTTGALKQRTENSSRAWPGLVVADLEGDGATEIVVGRGGDQLTVYDANGVELWRRNPFGGGEVRTLAAADIDQDQALEIVVGRASGGSTKQLSVYEADGMLRPGWPARRDGEAGYGWGMYNENVAVADLTGDGYAEIIGPTDTHYVTALDRDGNQLPVNARYDNFNPKGAKVWSQVGVHVDDAVDLRGYADCGVEHRPNFANSAPTLADLDGDGRREIVIIGNVYNCGTDPYTDLYLMPFIFNVDRTRWQGAGYDWTVIPSPDAHAAPLSQDYNIIENVAPNPVPVDLDGDGIKEILFPSYDGRLHAYRLDKTEHGNWPYAVYAADEGVYRFASEPVVADLDNNGTGEVIFASWPEKGANLVGKLHILDNQGNLLFEVELPSPFSGDRNGALAAPTLANLDDDPDLEVVLNTAHAGLVAYDLPGTPQARILWGSGRGGYLRKGAD